MTSGFYVGFSLARPVEGWGVVGFLVGALSGGDGVVLFVDYQMVGAGAA